MDCIFCKIISGEIPSSKVYEDEDFLAILDIRPVNHGHTLLIPKKHFVNIFDTDDDIARKIYPVLIKISKGIKEGLLADGINIIQNNEKYAGQEVFHSHIHIIPRFREDSLKFTPRNLSYKDEDEKNKIVSKIREKIK
ncbi:HIT family protein [Calditerrivibrio nitroreducens]|uniref:Histidine triad (HIT) protein n=1 Tax=Calditerrivibrio nitroreducens (strain DSM 19672 / NBRC 101217 / Yu37-1) TaxID=768670 RepID=E4THN6_CALNY|nr:HIT family protein [Calditerrivibrio nitroreducens]ADR18861.1 histidine triad (HIT) protein [Calditerrivibrio nitroreducens DSM 19672]